MKTIKLFAATTAALVLLASCQQQEAETLNNQEELVPVSLTASFSTGETKVSYTETTADGIKLQPAWKVGDKIIGFDEATPTRNTYTFTVSKVDATTGFATLDGECPASCTLHLIYLCGASASSISSGSLSVSYESQAGTGSTGNVYTMPAVMLADGEVAFGSGDFHFSNAGAVIGISAVKGVPSGSTISKITVEGENLSTATIALSGSNLALTATTNAADTISTAALSGVTVKRADGTLSKPVFIAVPAGAKIAKVSAFVPKEPETMKIPSTAADKKDIDYVEIAAKYDGTTLSTKKWAKWNVGANSQSDYGWYFPWAGTEGYVRYAESWQLHDATSIEFSYTLSSSKTAGAGDYLYVKKQSFTPAGHSLDWENTPYHNGNNPFKDWFKYFSTGSSADNKLVLDSEDDAAFVNWGGTWSMPTQTEFKALYDATYWAWDATDKGCYVFSPDETHTAGTMASSIPAGLSKEAALLFFPAAGYGMHASLENAGSSGYYWSSRIFPVDDANAYFLYLDIDELYPQRNYPRRYGQSVRPVSD